MRNPSIAGLFFLLGLVFLGAGCDRPQEAPTGGVGEVVIALLPPAGGGVLAEEVGAVADAIRSRLERLGFGGIEVATRPGDELLIRFSSAPPAGDPWVLMGQAFSRPGLLELKRLHADSAKLVKDLKLLAEAGEEWGVVQDGRGGRFVVSEQPILTGRQVVGVEVSATAGGGGFDVVVRFDLRSTQMFGELKGDVGPGGLALLLDGTTIAAPLPAYAMENGTVLVTRGVSEAVARELAFVLDAPLVVPLQIKGGGAM